MALLAIIWCLSILLKEDSGDVRSARGGRLSSCVISANRPRQRRYRRRYDSHADIRVRHKRLAASAQGISTSHSTLEAGSTSCEPRFPG